MENQIFSEENFWKKIDRIQEILKNTQTVFVQESFSDWINDMDDTDWETWEQEPDLWMKTLFDIPDAAILTELEQFRENCEEYAYKDGN